MIHRKPEEIRQMEESLVEYQGEDRIVSSYELEKYVEENNVTAYNTGVQSIDRILNGVEAGEMIIVSGPTGEGKCLGINTPVIMYSGEIKKVQNIKIGEYLMGPDSKPRKVLALGRGKGRLYKVKQTKGDNYIVNEDHILVLKKTGTNKTIEITIKDYLKQSKNFKRLHKGFSVPITYKAKQIPVDPYLIGLWLGDGHKSSLRITTADDEIVKYLSNFAIENSMNIKKTIQRDNKSSVFALSKMWKNEVWKKMCLLSLKNNKHIPDIYKTSSKEDRLQIMAGLIDSDGYTNHGGYVFVNKNKELAQGFAYIARSLGLKAYIQSYVNKVFNQEYWKVGISGDCSQIPVKVERKKVNKRIQIKDVLNTGIEVEYQEIGDYFGFEIDGDGRFLLGDFTVTHNTTLLMSITKNMSQQDISSLWFTLEVTPRSFIQKMKKGCGDNIPLFYMPNRNTDNQLDWIEQRIIEAKVKHDVKVVFIDHIHQIFSLHKANGGNISLEIGDMTGRIKQMAIDHHLIIFLIAHTRDNSVKPDAEPRKEEIRDSGLISRLADAIIMVWRIKNGDFERTKRPTNLDPDDTQSKVRIVKNRREGRMGTLLMDHKDGLLTEILDVFSI